MAHRPPIKVCGVLSPPIIKYVNNVKYNKTMSSWIIFHAFEKNAFLIPFGYPIVVSNPLPLPLDGLSLLILHRFLVILQYLLHLLLVTVGNLDHHT